MLTPAAIAMTVLLASPTSAAVLTFEEILSRANRTVSPEALDAARALETPRASLPTFRFETSASSAETVDVFAENVLRFDALTMMLAVDYPLLDGGLRAAQARVAKLDAGLFRGRVGAMSEERYRETVDAVAKLYLAQERIRLLESALARASGMRERARQMSEVREISNTTAALWEEQALGAESQRLELELQRLDAEGEVKQLIGDTTGEPVEIMLDLDRGGRDVRPPWTADVSSARAERARAAVDEANAARRPQLLLSAFGGAAQLSDRERFGLYGIRVSVALPMFDAAATRRVAEAKLQAEEAELERRAASEREARSEASRKLAIAATEKRIALLTRSVEVAAQREQSVVRLAAAGVRSESDAARAAIERTMRESDLLAARVDLWKLTR